MMFVGCVFVWAAVNFGQFVDEAAAVALAAAVSADMFVLAVLLLLLLYWLL